MSKLFFKIFIILIINIITFFLNQKILVEENYLNIIADNNEYLQINNLIIKILKIYLFIMWLYFITGLICLQIS